MWVLVFLNYHQGLVTLHIDVWYMKKKISYIPTTHFHIFTFVHFMFYIYVNNSYHRNPSGQEKRTWKKVHLTENKRKVF